MHSHQILDSRAGLAFLSSGWMDGWMDERIAEEGGCVKNKNHQLMFQQKRLQSRSPHLPREQKGSWGFEFNPTGLQNYCRPEKRSGDVTAKVVREHLEGKRAQKPPLRTRQEESGAVTESQRKTGHTIILNQ